MTHSYSDYGRLWALDPSVTFLNHGSFGACTHVVLEAQRALRDRMEEDPIRFFKRDLEGLLDQARTQVASFVGADPQGFAFVPNTTTGVNAVLRSLRLERRDELVITTHAYNACRNALAFVAQRAGAKVVEAALPFPLDSAEDISRTILNAVTPRTRLVLLDHVTSSTGLRVPIEPVVRELSRAGVDTLVDGAHAPGMLDVKLDALGATYYVGNCHKWLCAPKGAAFLHVAPQRRDEVRPLGISHGANSPRTDRSRYHLEFDWIGTMDPSPSLTVPIAIEQLGSLLPGGWPALRERNRSLALEARRHLCQELALKAPCPDNLVGWLAAIPLPDATSTPPRAAWERDPLEEALYERYRIEVPVSAWPNPPNRVLRLSAHLYNDSSQYAYLAEALKQLLPSVTPA